MELMKKFNWPLWAGFLLCISSFVSYPFVFVRWPMTRDFPWVNLLLFVIAAWLVFIGARRAFAPGRRLGSKIIGAGIAMLSVLVLGLFIFAFLVVGRWMPPAHGAPQVGQRAPDFTLTDTNNKSVSLSDLRTQPLNGKTPKGVLLIFYRGYW